MLSKMQKTWAWIFGAMVVVPEVLWGSLLKVIKMSYLPIFGNVQIFTDKPELAYLVIIIEIVGVGGFIYLVNKYGQPGKMNYLLNIFLGIILVFLVIALLMSYAISNVRLL